MPRTLTEQLSALALGLSILFLFVLFLPTTESPPETVVVPQSPEPTRHIPPTEPVGTTPSATQDITTVFSDTLPASYVPTTAQQLAIVNIICTSRNQNTISSITGSGVIIDPRGVILTNAHVAQHLLLELALQNRECVVRQGRPAREEYAAEVLYLPPVWIEENASLIAEKTPRGTGEHDFALLRITESSDSSPLPSSFSYITPDPEATGDSRETISLDRGDSVFVLSYPAEFLSGQEVFDSLQLLYARSEIRELFTFGDNHLDLLDMTGSLVAQRGSSGGAVIGADGLLKALIVTATQDELLGDRSLRAITLGHVDRALRELNTTDLAGLLAGDLETTARVFNLGVAPRLIDLLLEEMP